MSKDYLLKTGETAVQLTTHDELLAMGDFDTFVVSIIGLINFWAQKEQLVKPKHTSEVIPCLLADTFVASFIVSPEQAHLPFLCSYAQAMLGYQGLFYLTSNVTLSEYQRQGFGTRNILARLDIWRESYSHLQPVTQVSSLNKGIIATLTGLGAQQIARPSSLPPDLMAKNQEKLFYDLSTIKTF